MKLLIICQYFYPEQFRVSDVSFKLAEMGHDVTVLTGLPNYPAGEIFNGYIWDSLPAENFDHSLGAYIEILSGVKVIRCHLSPRKTGKVNLFRNYLSFIYQASKVARRMTLKGKSHFDKILVFQFSPVTMAIPAIIIKNKLKAPLLLYCFDLWPESIVSAGLPNHGSVYKSVLRLSRWIYSKADTLMISSQSFREYFEQKLNINKTIHYLPIYAEELFSDTAVNDEINNSDDSSVHANRSDQEDRKGLVRLLFAGNIGKMQSMDTIIKAAHHVRDRSDIQFHIVGDGSALQKTISLSDELSLNNIIFHGRHPLEDMPKYYSMADAFLVTLKKDPFISYTLPGKVQSYMAFGKPIIASVDGEAHDIIRAAGCGLCCDAEDDKGLAELILKFAENKNNHRAYGDCSRLYYQSHFSEASFFAVLLQLLEE